MTGGNSRRLVLVTSCLGGGGAERIVATMAAYWAHAGHEVHVVALRADEKGPAYTFPATVRIHRLRLIVEHNAVFDIRHIGRLWRLRRLLVGIRPALVLSFIDKLNVAVLLSGGHPYPGRGDRAPGPVDESAWPGVGTPACGGLSAGTGRGQPDPGHERLVQGALCREFFDDALSRALRNCSGDDGESLAGDLLGRPAGARKGI